MSNSSPQATLASNSLELCIWSLTSLVKQRVHERDEALLERDLARRERDTAKQMLCATLTLLHDADSRNRRLVLQIRSRFGLEADQTYQLQYANDALDGSGENAATGHSA